MIFHLVNQSISFWGQLLISAIPVAFIAAITLVLSNREIKYTKEQHNEYVTTLKNELKEVKHHNKYLRDTMETREINSKINTYYSSIITNLDKISNTVETKLSGYDSWIKNWNEEDDLYRKRSYNKAINDRNKKTIVAFVKMSYEYGYKQLFCLGNRIHMDKIKNKLDEFNETHRIIARNLFRGIKNNYLVVEAEEATASCYVIEIERFDGETEIKHITIPNITNQNDSRDQSDRCVVGNYIDPSGNTHNPIEEVINEEDVYVPPLDRYKQYNIKNNKYLNYMYNYNKSNYQKDLYRIGFLALEEGVKDSRCVLKDVLSQISIMKRNIRRVLDANS